MASAGEACNPAWVPAEAREARHKQINRQITCAAGAGKLEWVLQVVGDNLSEMNLINFSTALHRIAKLALGCSSQVREHICDHPVIRALQDAIVGHVCHSITLDRPAGRADAGRHDAMTRTDRQSEMRCLSIICWSCATLRLREDALFNHVSKASTARLAEMKPFELSNMLWAFAKLSLGSKQFYDSLTPHLLQRTEGFFAPQCLSTVVWAFGTAKVHQAQVFKSFAKELAAGASEMAPQGIANTAWAFARVRRQDAPLFRALAEAAVANDAVWTFKPQEISNIAWAFATVGLPHEQLFEKIMEVAIAWRADLPPQNIANMLWAYAKLVVPARCQLFPSLLEVASGHLEQYKPQEIAAILWAVAREVRNIPVCRDFFKEVPAQFTHRLPDFTAQALACMLEAFTLAEVDETDFFNATMGESISRLSSFQPPSLCTLLRGIVLKVEKGGPTQVPADDAQAQTQMYLEVVSRHTSERLHQMLPHNMLHLVQTLDMLHPNSRVTSARALANHHAIVALQKQRSSSSGSAIMNVQAQGCTEGAELFDPSLPLLGHDDVDDPCESTSAPTGGSAARGSGGASGGPGSAVAAGGSSAAAVGPAAGGGGSGGGRSRRKNKKQADAGPHPREGQQREPRKVEAKQDRNKGQPTLRRPPGLTQPQGGAGSMANVDWREDTDSLPIQLRSLSAAAPDTAIVPTHIMGTVPSNAGKYAPAERPPPMQPAPDGLSVKKLAMATAQLQENSWLPPPILSMASAMDLPAFPKVDTAPPPAAQLPEYTIFDRGGWLAPGAQKAGGAPGSAPKDPPMSVFGWWTSSCTSGEDMSQLHLGVEPSALQMHLHSSRGPGLPLCLGPERSTYGVGDEVVLLGDGNRVVVKRLQTDPAAVCWLAMETQSLAGFLRPVVRVHGPLGLPGCFFAYPFHANGSLGDTMARCREVCQPLSLQEIAAIALGVLATGQQLLTKGLGVEAIRVGEIFLEKGMKPLVRIGHPVDSSGAHCVWLSPEEALAGHTSAKVQVKPPSGTQAQLVYRLGLLIYCLGSGLRNPFPGHPVDAVCASLVCQARGGAPHVPLDWSRFRLGVSMRELVGRCLLQSPVDRLSPVSLRQRLEDERCAPPHFQ